MTPIEEKLYQEIQEKKALRKRARSAEARAARRGEVIAEQNRMLIVLWLRGRIIDPSIFFAYVDVDRCTDAYGRLVWTELDRALEELLADHPAFATHPEDQWQHEQRAVDWFPAKD